MWEAWRLSQAYRKPPSELYHIHDELAAWSFDRAVWMFGSTLDAELREAADGAKSTMQARQKQQRVMSKWLGTEMKYRDPAGGGGAAAPKQDGTTAPVVSSDATGPVSL